jgi:hypothetical protein
MSKVFMSFQNIVCILCNGPRTCLLSCPTLKYLLLCQVLVCNLNRFLQRFTKKLPSIYICNRT